MDEKEAYAILDKCSGYIGEDVADGCVLLDGGFSAEEISAIAWLIRAGKTSLRTPDDN